MNLASDLIKKLPESTGKLEYLHCANITRELTSVEKKLKFEEVSSVLILKTLKEFETNKTTGVDNLAERFLKDGSNTLCTPIAKICNLSIKFFTSPDKCKVTKIKSLYKKGLETDQKNFWPISLLPIISKIIERTIYDQTINFLSDSNVL